MTPDNNPGGMMPDRDPLALAMLAAWLNVPVNKLPPTMKAHTCASTMAAWKRVGEAALAYIPKAPPPADMVDDERAREVLANVLNGGGDWPERAAAIRAGDYEWQLAAHEAIRAMLRFAAAPQSPPAKCRCQRAADQGVPMTCLVCTGPVEQSPPVVDAGDPSQLDINAALDKLEVYFNVRGVLIDSDRAGLRIAHTTLKAAAEALAQAQAREKALRAGLEDVANPLGKLRREAEAQGAQLSGMAYSIANDLGFVQQIARTTLSRTGEG